MAAVVSVVSRLVCGSSRRAASAAYSTARDGSSGPAPAASAVPPVPSTPSSGSPNPAQPHLHPPNAPTVGRSFSSSSTVPKIDNKTFLWSRYGEMKKLVQGIHLHPSCISGPPRVGLQLPAPSHPMECLRHAGSCSWALTGGLLTADSLCFLLIFLKGGSTCCDIPGGGHCRLSAT